MDSVMIICALCVLFLCQTVGSSDVKNLFVQTGKDVRLEIPDPGAVEGYTFFAWRLKKNNSDPDILVSFPPGNQPKIRNKYKETVFPEENLSVTLKNLQKADSGLYDAEMIKDKQVTLVTYNITVVDPVSPVSVSVNSVTFSPDCNVTVSCTTDHYTITTAFTCTNQTCTDQGNKSVITPSAASLHIYLSDGSITCNHSNQANWTIDSTPINLCLRRSGNEGDVNNKRNIYVVFAPIIGIIVIIIISAVVSWCYWKKREGQKQCMDDIYYAAPEVSSPNPNQTLAVNEVDSLTSTYSLVGPHPGSKETLIPESLYAQVQKY